MCFVKVYFLTVADVGCVVIRKCTLNGTGFSKHVLQKERFFEIAFLFRVIFSIP